MDAVDFQEVEERAARAVRQNEPLRIAVTNANKCFLATRDAELRGFLGSAEIVVPETSVAWGCSILGHRDVHAVWGVTLAERLLSRADRESWSVYLFGARPRVLEALVARVRRDWPSIRVAGAEPGYLGEARDAEVREQIWNARPDLLLVGLGSPRQERFIAELWGARGWPEASGRPPARAHPTPAEAIAGPGGALPSVALGVGGSFDVHAGFVRDAPSWVRGSGFEWLWRAARSPRLFLRYAVVNPWFVVRVLLERLRMGPSSGDRDGVNGGSASPGGA